MPFKAHFINVPRRQAAMAEVRVLLQNIKIKTLTKTQSHEERKFFIFRFMESVLFDCSVAFSQARKRYVLYYTAGKCFIGIVLTMARSCYTEEFELPTNVPRSTLQQIAVLSVVGTILITKNGTRRLYPLGWPATDGDGYNYCSW